jgi:outer membrane protein assembly factor BamB
MTPGGIEVSPPTDSSGYLFNPVGISADPLNHVAVLFANEAIPEGPQTGPNQIGIYTIGANGTLSTTSTYGNMLNVPAGDTGLKMSVSGKVLAGFGATGLEIFHFNGANPVTPFATLLQNKDIEQVFWDNANHLFAVSQKSGKLYVFTVTPTSFSQAPGSPHSISGAQNLAVQSLTVN